MRRLALLAAVLSLLLSSKALAYPVLGSLVSAGTSVNNVTTAAPFSVPAGGLFFVQCNGAAYVNIFTSAAAAVATASNAIQLQSGQLFPLPGSSGAIYIAELPVSGAVTCVVFSDAP